MTDNRDANAIVEQALWLPRDEDERALKLLEEAISIAPDFPRIYCARGLIWYRRSDLLSAESDFHQALSLDPNHINSLYNLGVTFFEQRNFAKAKKTFEKAIAVVPEKRSFFYLGRVNLSLRNFSESIANFTEVLSTSCGDANAFFHRGIAYARSNDFQRALVDLDQAYIISDKYFAVGVWKASVLIELMRYQEAIECLATAISQNKKFAEAHFQHGLAKYFLGEFP